MDLTLKFPHGLGYPGMGWWTQKNQFLSEGEPRKNQVMDPNWTQGFAIKKNKVMFISGPLVTKFFCVPS